MQWNYRNSHSAKHEKINIEGYPANGLCTQLSQRRLIHGFYHLA